MTAARGRRAGLFAVLMMLLTLGAVSLVSTAAVASPHLSAAAETSHDHHTGTEWTPTPSHRLRPAADVSGGAIIPAGAHAPAPVDLVVTAGGDGRGDEASILVLRV
ncbi:hypothetical protein [Paractinoplanes lichenicola]|uniref:Uncharacterized protein n=1 Tax=Paractinoplanes lichenicola TaxID=2802976 RepID=A0ABS1VI69_9ACTN|nr:hypothetical protein [Actinoplanes lichenicola]MBL7254408.1 hypothetical protein [Actinoplanes lichenicola]